MGLLDGISDPEIMAEVENRSVLAEHLAAAHGWSFEHALIGLAVADLRAIDRFCVGNTIPTRERH